jgi:hypothetical protein
MVKLSGAAKRRIRRRQEQRWAARSGKVRTYHRDDLPPNSVLRKASPPNLGA